MELWLISVLVVHHEHGAGASTFVQIMRHLVKNDDVCKYMDETNVNLWMKRRTLIIVFLSCFVQRFDLIRGAPATISTALIESACDDGAQIKLQLCRIDAGERACRPSIK